MLQSRPYTHDEHLLLAPHEVKTPFRNTNPWRVMRVMSEFVRGFDELAEIGPAVTLFGSARVQPDAHQYQQAVETARLFKRGRWLCGHHEWALALCKPETKAHAWPKPYP